MNSRLDKFLVSKYYFATREKAVQAIKQGYVKVNGFPVEKPSFLVSDNDILEITKQLQYVSRGGYKLQKAVRHFNIFFQNKSVLDIGASTGGFTDCALQNGAAFVVAVDIGTGQLDKSLLDNDKVFSFEKTDIRTLDPDQLPVKQFEVIVGDLSFISLKVILPFLHKFSTLQTEFILLLKPQFEAGKGVKMKKGILKDARVRNRIVEDFKKTIIELGFQFIELIETDADGISKNIEYLIYFKRLK